MALQYDPALTARTRTGTFIGKRSDSGTITFLGIPYARFQGRFRPLAELPGSETIAEAYELGPACPQGAGVEPCPHPMDEENCFNLTVSTRSLSGKKPVYVYIHGGSNISGGNYHRAYDTAHFVDWYPDVVCVVINYRLSTLGHLYLADLDPSYNKSGSLTIDDQVMALKWVHENIAAFGGDPDNVTIGGQSSGSNCIVQHMGNPKSWPYWNKAICESGSPLWGHPLTIGQAIAGRKKLFDLLGISTIEEALAIDPMKLVEPDTMSLGVKYVMDGEAIAKDLCSKIIRGDEGAVPTGKTILLIAGSSDRDGRLADRKSLEDYREAVVGEITETISRYLDEELELFAQAFLPGVPGTEAVAFLRGLTREDLNWLMDLYIQNDPARDPRIACGDCLNDYHLVTQMILFGRGLSKENTAYELLFDGAPQEIYPIRSVHGALLRTYWNTNYNKRRFVGDPMDPNVLQNVHDLWDSFYHTGKLSAKGVTAEPFDASRRTALLFGHTIENLTGYREETPKLLGQLYREWKGRMPA